MESQRGVSSPNQSIRKLIAGTWESLDGVRGRFFLFVFLFIGAYSIDLLSPWAIGYTLGVFVERGFSDEALNSALLGVGLYVAIRLVHTVLHHLGRYVQLTVSFAARMKTLERTFSTLLAFPLRWHVEHHSGENLSRLHRIAGAIDMTIGTFVWQIVEGLTKIIFASIALFALDTWVAVNVAAMGVCTLLIMVLFNQRLVGAIRANNSFSDRLNQTFVDYLFHVVTIKSLSLERTSVDYMKNRRAPGYALNRRIVRFSELKWGSVGLGYTMVIGTSLVIYFLGHKGSGTPIAVAEVYVLINYLDRIFQAIGSFTGYYSGVLEAATAYEDAVKIDHEARTHQAGPRAAELPAEWSTMTLQNLQFSYSNDRSGGLQTKELTLKRGEKIALVGPSGAGKSTLLKIMGGLLVPERCDILLDGTKKVSLDSVTQSALILPQEPEIFSETAAYNLSMGEEFSERELRFFVTLCKLDEVLEKLPQGWDSSLAESGMNISVGEKQRLALARGLLRARRRAILLLDEPTSSLDPATEKQIFQSMLHHFADRTVLTACHRLALVPLFDRIIFVRRGVIEESGSFQELLDKRGLFFQVWSDYESTQRTGAAPEVNL